MVNVINVFALHARPGKSLCQQTQISQKGETKKKYVCDFNSRVENQKLWARKSYTSNLMGLHDTFHTRFDSVFECTVETDRLIDR